RGSRGPCRRVAPRDPPQRLLESDPPQTRSRSGGPAFPPGFHRPAEGTGSAGPGKERPRRQVTKPRAAASRGGVPAMITADQEPSDEHVSSLAAAWDEALAEGVPAPPLPALQANAEMQPHLLRGLACLQVLRQVWPRQRAPAGTPTPPTEDAG